MSQQTDYNSLFNNVQHYSLKITSANPEDEIIKFMKSHILWINSKLIPDEIRDKIENDQNLCCGSKPIYGNMIRISRRPANSKGRKGFQIWFLFRSNSTPVLSIQEFKILLKHTRAQSNCELRFSKRHRKIE